MLEREEPTVEVAERDYRDHVREAYHAGVSYVPDFLTLAAIAVFLDAYKQVENSFSGFKQPNEQFQMFAWKESDGEDKQLLPEASAAIGRLIAESGKQYQALKSWRPNWFNFLRYGYASFIDPHQDLPDFRGIGVTVTLQGEADFSVHKTVQDEPFATWRTKPGDAVFLRMNGFNPRVPYSREIAHSVGGARTSEMRIAALFRHHV